MKNKPFGRIQRLQQGVTLVELVTTLGIAGILFSLAGPSLSSLISNNQMTSAINDLVSHLHFARSEAIKRGEYIFLCPTLNGTACDDSFDWHQGIMIFVDRDKDKVRDTNEQILQVRIPFSKQISIKTSTGRKKLRYLPTGTSPGSTATFSFCHQSDQIDPRKVTLSNTGRPRISRNTKEKNIACG